jgi:large subunit ribosomal protein L9
MQLILLESVDKLGKVGDLVKVADGYGRNYLLPRKKAMRATKENIDFIQARKEQLEKENLDKISLAKELLKKLEGKSFSIARQAAEDGRLYGSVTTRDISKAINKECGVEVSYDSIVITSKFKEIGEYDVIIMPHSEVKSPVRISIVRGEQAA